jgi:energy-coupling factor transporter ATP-binding protein EcfA2
MPKFIIDKIGPIEHVDFTLNKVNMLIGPQSSGKSTIAKVVSFCLWLEKDVLMHRNSDYVSRDFVEKQLLEFHKLKNYQNKGYAIFFVGDAIDFCYTEERCFANLKDKFEECKIGKIAYIPAERNAVTLPNIASLKMPEYNTRSFIFDWLEVHQKFQKKDAVNLLKLKLKYYYDESSQKDMIILEDGKEIGLEEASSGLQSVVPLYVYVYYLTHWVYDHQEDVSFDKREKIEKALINKYIKGLTKDEQLLGRVMRSGQFIQQCKEMLGTAKSLKNAGDVPVDDLIETVLELEENISHPHYSNIIVEEPELNLFPETQKDLIYDLLGMINSGRDHLLMTTHSPYLLYALNNCMLGSLVQENMPEEEEELQKMKDSFVKPEDVSVWEIKNGKFLPYKENPNYTIQDEKGLIRNNYFDRIMKNIMTDFAALMDYCDED